MSENFSIKDIIDILLVAMLMYQLYILVSKSGSLSAIFKGILAFIIIWILVSYVFEMRLLGAIFDKFVSLGLLVLVVIFQDEIRRFLMSLGSHSAFKAIASYFKSKDSYEMSDTITAPIIVACTNMAKTKTGALLVIEKEIKLDEFEKTGEVINADVNTRLIENIFFKNSPLHDGAMIISGNRIKAAGCILPVAQNTDIPKYMGLRHRAAIGISQQTDAMVIVVSEERGKISFANQGEIIQNVSPEQLKRLLADSLLVNTDKK